ncbi:homoserine kinase [Stackebrandtia albiflava]|uniref:Homoserine kinase n=1 Tax=Stackebrandtia albiflava TaxID=406432 RepID=A0A562ULJ6_9ACTN|nr:phosphotransferase [Stackebrandtia albiflava]TWJ06466.1 homoserine kinase [Stackebrandtia albiflava]
MTMDLNPAELLSRYGRTPTTEPVELPGGQDNRNLRIGTDLGDVVVRQYLRSPLERIRAELELVDFLARRGYPTPAPLPLRAGRFLSEQEPPVAVFEFARGRAADGSDGAPAAQTGELLARLHTLTSGWLDARIPEYDRVAALRATIDGPFEVPGAEEWRAAVESFLAENSTGLAELAELPAGPLHHDMHGANLLVENGRITAVLDFDELNHGPLVIDLARALFYLAVAQPDRGLPAAPAEALVAGYRSARMLTGPEHAALPVAFGLVALVDAAEVLTGGGLASVSDCHSWQVFRANEGALAGL